MNPKILSLLPKKVDTRIVRRVDLLKQAGFVVQATGFDRPHRGGRLPDCPVESLGYIRDGHHAARIPKLLLAVRKVRLAIRRNEIVYAFNSDLALLALIAGVGLKRPVVLEVADLNRIQVAGGLVGHVVRAMEKLTSKRCRLLVLPTAGYYPYYRDWLQTDTPGIVMENKLGASFAASIRAVVPPEPSGHPRYYDACLFQKPLIVRARCSDADEVRPCPSGLTGLEEGGMIWRSPA